MKGLKLIIAIKIFFGIMILIQSCGCKERTLCPLEDYKELIGMYKSDNWWIYETSDGLLSDTIVVGKTDTVTIRDFCKTFYEFRAELSYYSKNYSSSKNELKATTIYCNTLFFGINLEMTDHVWFNISDSQSELDFKKSINYRGEEINDIAFIQSGNPDYTMFYEREIGLSGWINHDTQDTFYLTKYFIQ